MIRWGMIGCGSVTEIKSGPAFQKVKNSELVAVCSRTAELVSNYADKHEIPKWTTDPEEVIFDSKVNAIYIATPPSTHKVYTLLAARAGKPVYVEKPMALSFYECEEMMHACKKASVPLFVAYYRRRLPRFMLIESLLHQRKVVGRVRFVTILLSRGNEARYQDKNNLPWTVKPEISGGGLFVDLGCHTLDILDYLLGPISEVVGFSTSQLSAYPAEDSVTLAFNFANGIQGSGIWNFTSHGREDRVEIVGNEGTLTFATFGDEPITLKKRSGEYETFHIENPIHIQQPLIQSVVNQLIGIDSCPSTGESAARTQKVMDKALLNCHSQIKI
jgi:predicted dehydrogenase